MTAVARNPVHVADELEPYRRLQRLAYDAVEQVAGDLQPGMTEREAARRVRDTLSAHGIDEYFHRPFAWFGDRTAFRGFWTPLHFFPTSRRLEAGMPVILDVAPMRDGYAADIGYAFSHGGNPIQDQLNADLELFRSLILAGVRAEKSLRQIYGEVDDLIEDLGYDNRHRAYPMRVLAHRVDRLPGSPSRLHVGGFGVRTLAYFRREMQAHTRIPGHPTPFWNDARQSDRRPAECPGLWAVEPHIGFRGVGAKWEELLVVGDGDARWLDDDLPHVRRWRRA